ncbi:MAG: hypothetical protein N2Z65_08310 [Clostridiales bacterium]|nr:hypothetical protein [Clostridiales bacterium]
MCPQIKGKKKRRQEEKKLIKDGFGRFSDCQHKSEPDCAIIEAIANGELSKERWSSYLQIKREVKFADDKAGFLLDKSKRNKSIAQLSRQNKKNGGFKK